MEIINDTKENLAKKAAELIAKKIPEIMENFEKSKINLGVVGGSSVGMVFDELKKQNIEWKNVNIWMVDERFATLDSPDLNFTIAKNHFVDELVSSGKLPAENVFPFEYKPEIEDHGVGEYSAKFQENGTTYDIALLSSGEDGHVGSLFPFHPSIEDQSPFFIAVKDAPKDPPDRISASFNLISQSTVGLILFFGSGKEEAFNNFTNPNIDKNTCPAKVVEHMHEGYVYKTL